MLSRSLFAIGCAVATNCAAWAGAGQAYTASQEQGVVVFRGQPANAPLPTVAEIYQNREAEKRGIKTMLAPAQSVASAEYACAFV